MIVTVPLNTKEILERTIRCGWVGTAPPPSIWLDRRASTYTTTAGLLHAMIVYM